LSEADYSPKQALAMALEEQAKRIKQAGYALYKPYPKQLEFHKAGNDLSIRERLLMAGNQLGKTVAAANEVAMHSVGDYPDWWEGAFFDSPTVGWAASLTSQVTRDTVQRLLLGQPGSWGTGAIPSKYIEDIKRAAHGVADAVESILVKHVSGGTSRITLKSYDQGRERFQGETLDYVWFDEEPPQSIYMEGLTRTNATQGIVWLTFTPLLGMSDVVKRFLVDKMAGTHVTAMTINDALHYTPEQRAAIIASYPAHERDARAMGIPTMGSGKIFPIVEESIKERPFSIPDHWPRICGIDFGWDHPTALAWLAWDRDTDTVHLYDVYRSKEETPVIHTASYKARGSWIPVAWPHDGLQHDKGSGIQLADIYRKHGMKMLKHQASHSPAYGQAEGSGGNSVEKGLLEMLEMMMEGRFKVFDHLEEFFSEFRMYHRKDGKIVKVDDDIISASRYAFMMRRFAEIPQPKRRERLVAAFQPMDSEVGY
jgi:phage terminase large subunit-like protein